MKSNRKKENNRNKLKINVGAIESIRDITDIKAEQQRLLDVMETLPVMVCLVRPDYRIPFANRAFRNVFGESNGRPCYDYVFGQTEPCQFCETFEVLKTNVPHHWLCHTPNGRVIDVYDYPFIDTDGTKIVLEMDIDITERIYAEKALKESEEKYRSIFDHSLDAILLTTPEGSILEANKAALDMFGRSLDELRGIGRNGLVDQSDANLHEALKKRDRNGIERAEIIMLRANGERFPVEITSAIFTDIDGCQKTSMVIRDITERKRAEELIQQANLYNRSLIEASLDPLATVDHKGRITDVNASAEDVTGRSRAELIGTDFSSYFTEPKRAKSGYLKAFKEGLVRDYELEIKHVDGHTTPVIFNASVFKDKSGNTRGIFAAARDITLRKMFEEELTKKSDVLEDLNTALKVLTDRYKNEQKELEDNIVANIRDRITPYIERLKHTRLDAGQSVLVEIIERSFYEITSSFVKSISQIYYKFSRKEMEIVPLIKDGKTTKEIAEIMGLGKRTVDSYRDNIRTKLGLTNKKANLRTYLLSIDNH